MIYGCMFLTSYLLTEASLQASKHLSLYIVFTLGSLKVFFCPLTFRLAYLLHTVNRI
jgi:hypothetical protein